MPLEIRSRGVFTLENIFVGVGAPITLIPVHETWLGMNDVHALLLSAASGAVLAIWGVFSQRQIARRNATLLHIERTESDNDLIAARAKFVELALANGGLAAWAEADKQDTIETQQIKLVLNEFELVSIGIQRGVIDFKFFAKFFKTNTITHWNYAHEFIDRLRTRTNRGKLYYQEFEKLAGWMERGRPSWQANFYGLFF